MAKVNYEKLEEFAWKKHKKNRKILFIFFCILFLLAILYDEVLSGFSRLSNPYGLITYILLTLFLAILSTLVWSGLTALILKGDLKFVELHKDDELVRVNVEKKPKFSKLLGFITLFVNKIVEIKDTQVLENKNNKFAVSYDYRDSKKDSGLLLADGKRNYFFPDN